MFYKCFPNITASRSLDSPPTLSTTNFALPVPETLQTHQTFLEKGRILSKMLYVPNNSLKLSTKLSTTTGQFPA